MPPLFPRLRSPVPSRNRKTDLGETGARTDLGAGFKPGISTSATAERLQAAYHRPSRPPATFSPQRARWLLGCVFPSVRLWFSFGFLCGFSRDFSVSLRGFSVVSLGFSGFLWVSLWFLSGFSVVSLWFLWVSLRFLWVIENTEKPQRNPRETTEKPQRNHRETPEKRSRRPPSRRGRVVLNK